jgi:hypothetical protein
MVAGEGFEPTIPQWRDYEPDERVSPVSLKKARAAFFVS